MSVANWRPGPDDTLNSVVAELSTWCGPCEFTGSIDDNLDMIKRDNNCPTCTVEQTHCDRCTEGLMPEVLRLKMSGWNWLGDTYASVNSNDPRWVNYHRYYQSVPFTPAFCPGADKIHQSALSVADFWNRKLNGTIDLRSNLLSLDGLTDLGPQACVRSQWIICPEMIWKIDLHSFSGGGPTLAATAYWSFARITFGASQSNRHVLNVTLGFASSLRSQIFSAPPTRGPFYSPPYVAQDFCEEVLIPNVGYDYETEAAAGNLGTTAPWYSYDWAIGDTLSCFDDAEFDTDSYLFDPTSPIPINVQIQNRPHIGTVSGVASTNETPTAIGGGGGLPKGVTVDEYLDAVLECCLGCHDWDVASAWANGSADVDGDWVNESNADGNTSGTRAHIASGSETGVADTLECSYANLAPLPTDSVDQTIEQQNLDIYYELVGASGLDVTLNVYVQYFNGADHLIHTATQSGVGTLDKNTTPVSIDMSEYWKTLLQIKESTIKFAVSFDTLTAGGEARVYRSEASARWTKDD